MDAYDAKASSSHATPDDDRRILRIVRQALRVPHARLRWSSGGETPDRPVAAEDGVAGSLDAGTPDTDAPAAGAACIEAPIFVAGLCIGMLVAEDAESRAWTPDDRAALADIADCLAALMALRKLASADAPASRGADTQARAGLHDIEPDREEDDVPATDGAHILLADDLDLNRKLICDMLSLEGHVVDSVPDGASAVKAAGEHRYDLILMDMIMPVMDGVTATRAIRALPSPACEVPIVALTAHSLPEQLESCLQAGMDATLVKPMTMEALSNAVATWSRPRRQAA